MNKLTSVKEIYARLSPFFDSDSFNELYIDLWISDCLRDLNLGYNTSLHREDVEVINRNFRLPCFATSLYMICDVNGNVVKYTGTLLDFPKYHKTSIRSDMKKDDNLKKMETNAINNNYSDLTYYVNNDTIWFNADDVTVSIYYFRMDTDEDGLPMIPDLFYVIDTIETYVKMKIMELRVMRKEGDHVNLYNRFSQEYQIKRRSTLNKSKMMSLNKLASFNLETNRFIKLTNNFFDGFKQMNKEEHLEIRKPTGNGTVVNPSAPTGVTHFDFINE